ncbi:uncharacterized protein LOC113324245 [Papaver somniferum]|uniref:uncharacterized protein LOC113324245 n=1 Tax=Papaver somniferum TaxID=3469 RepID=UPI000E6FAF08|nr:uncharacterized protein LOC113324245 [Papaver somniferum]
MNNFLLENQLRSQLHSIKKGSSIISEFLHQLKTIADSLAEIGEPVPYEDLFDYNYQVASPAFEAGGYLEHSSSGPVWIPDSGASSHMTNDSSLLATSSAYTGSEKVMVGDGKLFHIFLIGSSTLSTSANIFDLHKVLYVPHLQHNLLFVAQFTLDNHCAFIFYPWGYEIKSLKNNLTLAKRKVQNGIYPIIPCTTPTNAFFSVIVASSSIWHSRLGHPSQKIIQKLVDDADIKLSSKIVNSVCGSFFDEKIFPFDVTHSAPVVAHSPAVPNATSAQDISLQVPPSPDPSDLSSCDYVAATSISQPVSQSAAATTPTVSFVQSDVLPPSGMHTRLKSSIHVPKPLPKDFVANSHLKHPVPTVLFSVTEPIYELKTFKEAIKHHIWIKWVFKTKLRADGTVERHKSRMVDKGYHQVNMEQPPGFVDPNYPNHDLGTLHYFLGIEATFAHTSKKLLLIQNKYSLELLQKHDMMRLKILFLSPPSSRSSTEAEYRGLVNVVAEILWVSYLFEELSVQLSLTRTSYCDNMGAGNLTTNPIFHARTKYIEVDYHMIRDLVKHGFLKVSYVHTLSQITVLFTKGLSKVQFTAPRTKLMPSVKA